MRLIDADALLADLNTDTQRHEKYIIDLITNAPTIEANSGEAVAWRVIGEGGIPVTDWIDGDGRNKTPAECIGGKWIQIAYTSPPKREWVELSDYDIKGLPQPNYDITTLQYVKIISAKLKEVNNG